MQDVRLLLRYSSIVPCSTVSRQAPSAMTDPTTPPGMCSMTDSSLNDHAGLRQEQVAIAGSALAADPNLRQMRFDCVPRFMTEEMFWQLYFAAVESIRQQVKQEQLQQHAMSWPARATTTETSDSGATDSFHGAHYLAEESLAVSIRG